MGSGISRQKKQKMSDSKDKQNKDKTPTNSDCQLTKYNKLDDEGTVPGRTLTQQVTGNQTDVSDMNVEDNIKSTDVTNTSNDVLEENKDSSANNTKSDGVGKQNPNAETKGPEKQDSGLVTDKGKGNVSSTDGTGKLLQVDSTNSHTKYASMAMGTDNGDNINEDEVDKMEDHPAGKTVSLSITCKDNQNNGSVNISKNESGVVQAKYSACKQSGELSSENGVTNDSANDNTDETDINDSYCNGKNTHSDNKLNASNENTTVSYSNTCTTNDDAEHQTVPENKTGNEQTPVNETDTEQSNEANNKKFEGSKATGSEQAESEYRLNDNLLFYQNQIHSRPFPGEKIDEMLKWKGNYLKLERSHSYIQWLFPIPESRGMNYSAQALQEHEAKAISEDETLRKRVLEAYKMMLDFYGMELVNDISGEVQRGENWKERYEHLDRSFHNRFRITRILKALGELGFEHFQEHWLEFIMHEATLNQQLPSLNGNCMDHWIGAVKDETTQGKLYCLLSDLNEQLNEAKLTHDDSVRKRDVATNGDNAEQKIVNQGVSHNNDDSNTGNSNENTEDKENAVNNSVSNVGNPNEHTKNRNATCNDETIKDNTSQLGVNNHDDGKNDYNRGNTATSKQKEDVLSTIAAENYMSGTNSKTENENGVSGDNAKQDTASQSVGNESNNVNGENEKSRDETAAEGNTKEADSSPKCVDGNVGEEHPVDTELETSDTGRQTKHGNYTEGSEENNTTIVSNTSNKHTSNEIDEGERAIKGTGEKDIDKGGAKENADNGKKGEIGGIKCGPTANDNTCKDKGKTQDTQPAGGKADKAVSNENNSEIWTYNENYNEGVKDNLGEKKSEKNAEKKRKMGCKESRV